MRLKHTENNFYYLLLGYEEKGRYSFLLWVNESLVDKDSKGEAHLTFPIKGQVVVTPKRNRVLKPSNDVYTFNLFSECGYKQNTDITILKNSIPHLRTIVPYQEHNCINNPALGISQGMLVSIAKPSIEYEVVRENNAYQFLWEFDGNSVLKHSYRTV